MEKRSVNEAVNRSSDTERLFSRDQLEEGAPLCGIDEAGRGPLAGPLVVAGVILLRRVNGLTDSKKLDDARRERLYARIVERSRFHLVLFDSRTVDREGISLCLKRALEEIRNVLGGNGERFLYDGNSRYGVSGIATMVRADGKVREVGAASILAKVVRDRMMRRYAREYPGYGFEHHMGYGTAEHIRAIRRMGYSPIHRRSFRIKELDPDEGPALF